MTESRTFADAAGAGASNSPARSFPGWFCCADGAESSKSIREVSFVLEELYGLSALVQCDNAMDLYLPSKFRRDGICCSGEVTLLESFITIKHCVDLVVYS